MVKPVDSLVPMFAKAGADIISFHPEASEHVDRTLSLIRESGCKGRAGVQSGHVAFISGSRDGQARPDSHRECESGFWRAVVHSGRAGKTGEARQRITASGRDIWLEVDGGVKADNIGAIAKAGADTFVAGSAIFGKPITRRRSRRCALN